MMSGKSDELAAIIMAAGKGTRMKSDLAKVLHPIRGRAMIHYVVETAQKLGASPIVVLVGHQKEKVMAELEGQTVRFAVQEPQLGTGHAVMCALPQLEAKNQLALILSGDVPLIGIETLKSLISHHRRTGAAATVLTARADHPKGYGRIVRQSSGHLAAIVEERDATEELKKIDEINSGIYVFNVGDLRATLPKLRTDNDQREYYLTEAVRLLASSGQIVAACEGSFQEVRGINTVAELADANRELPPKGIV